MNQTLIKIFYFKVFFAFTFLFLGITANLACFTSFFTFIFERVWVWFFNRYSRNLLYLRCCSAFFTCNRIYFNLSFRLELKKRDRFSLAYILLHLFITILAFSIDDFLSFRFFFLHVLNFSYVCIICRNLRLKHLKQILSWRTHVLGRKFLKICIWPFWCNNFEFRYRFTVFLRQRHRSTCFCPPIVFQYTNSALNGKRFVMILVITSILIIKT